MQVHWLVVSSQKPLPLQMVSLPVGAQVSVLKYVEEGVRQEKVSGGKVDRVENFWSWLNLHTSQFWLHHQANFVPTSWRPLLKPRTSQVTRSRQRRRLLRLLRL